MIYRRFFLLFLFISLFGIQLSYSAVARVRAMYRSENTSTSIVIGWEQTTGVVGTVYFDTINYGFLLNDSIPNRYTWHRYADRVVDYRGMKNCFARINNLIPGKIYYFTILDNIESTKIYSFKSMSNNPDDTLVILSGGDSRTDLPLIGETDNRLRRQAAFTVVQKLRPDFVTFSGNFIFNFPIQYSLISDSELEWQEWLDDWCNNTPCRTRLNGKTSYRIFPLVVAQGTHESTADLYNLFDTPNQDIYSAFSFCNGLFRLYTLNTNTAITGNQLTFLTNDLNTHQSTKWKMAHYCGPLRPHTNNTLEGDLTYDYWAPLFQQYKVNLVSEVGSQTCKQTWPIIPCASGTGCEDGFVRNDTLGTVFIGEGGCGSPLSDNNNTKIWTRASEKLDHINLIWVSKCKIEVRAVDYSGSYNLMQVEDTNRFKFPVGMKFWNTEYGKVLVIANRECLPSVEITSPADNSYISSINPVILTANASDFEGTIVKVEYYSNDTLIGFSNTSPYTISHVFGRNRTHNVVAMAYDNDGNNNISLPIRLISANSQDALVRVVASNDDAEESNTNGTVNIEGYFLDLNSDSLVGIRFNRPNISQGREVLGAYIQFTSSSNDNSASDIEIFGEYGFNARSFTLDTNNILNRRTTNESINWVPQAWVLDRDSTAEKTPDLGLILQEIVNQPGWTEYSSVAFIFRGLNGNRSAYSYDNDPFKAPVLTFEYKIQSTIGIEDNTASVNSLLSEIYPNPAKDRVYLKLHSNKKLSIKVFDMIGNICKSIELNECSGVYQMNISNLKAGVYMLSLDNGNISQTEKLIVK